MKHLHLTRVLAFALALVLLLGCTACGKKTTDDTGDTVGQKDTQTTVELDGKFTLNYSASAGMNPYKTQNSDNLVVCGLVYETLTELTDAFEAEPGLFTEWSSDDGETWTFTVAPAAPSTTATHSRRRTRPIPFRPPWRRICIPAA